jgi:VWFA-related protein
MNQRLVIYAFGLALVITFAIHSAGQQPGTTPPNSNPTGKPAREDQQESIKINVEEVQIPIAAYNAYGRLDPTVEINDLLILDNGIRQEARSVRQMTASVLLLLDTGGEINSAKNIRATREIARNLVSSLTPQDQVSVMQFNSNVELLQDWTTDKSQIPHVLDTKLLSGKRAVLSPALEAAVNQFRTQPVGCRYLVLITDGVETPGTKPWRAEAIERLLASNATVHVISYTAISRASTNKALRIARNRDKSTTPDDAINSLPPDDHGPIASGSFYLRQLHKPGGKTFDLDPERRRQIKRYQDDMIEGEFMLTSLSKETGGNIWLSESLDQMIADGAKVAHQIDAGYLVTYRPSPSLASANQNYIRQVEIISRRVGLNIISRRSYVVGAKQ